MKKQQGFTLIELMIVVAIIAILAAIAIPAYRDYLIRTQVSEGASLSGGAKVAVDEYYANYGVAPATNAAAGLATNTTIKGDYVSQVTVGAGGAITSTFSGTKANAAIAGKALVLTPTFNAGSTSWSCVGNGTNIDVKYLPSSCR
ncbi:pilin [Pseudoxanthomonas sacheonensis]|uniref:pilin n=1 Tax=Pseudoxanthomonas sacheonensis TaxID=443615 RepID=UPI0013D5FEBC|nr:pilin [Pseudoxanthomonas sacheonensis]KAF1708603.1 prepilin-type cleavage/methylation domain-containing protein [Pseudoxanthomonas sacheonensis]